MAIQLDFRTLSLTLMLFSLVFGLGMFAYSREHAKFSGIRTMGAGYLLIGGGCVLLGLRHFIYDFVSIVLANTAIIIGVVLIYRGLFRFRGISLRHERWLSTTLVLVLAALMYVYTFHIPDVNLRIQAFSIVFAAACLIGATRLIRSVMVSSIINWGSMLMRRYRCHYETWISGRLTKRRPKNGTLLQG